MANQKLSAPSALLLAVLLLVPLWLFVPRSRHASPQEAEPPPAIPPVTGKVELDRGRSLFSSGVGPAENVAIYLENPSIPPPRPLKGPLRMVQQSKRFEPFVTAGKRGGTGLGLAIVKRVVENHGGRVTFQTESGLGTRFILELPASDHPADGGTTGGQTLESSRGPRAS